MRALTRDLTGYLERQLGHFFPDGKPLHPGLSASVERALQKTATNFSYISNKYYQGPFESVFDRLNGDHYSMFLYRAARELYSAEGDENTSAKVFSLNKALHGLDAFYKIKLPDVFLFAHALGTVLGNADYSDFLVVYQNCTVGGNYHNQEPSSTGPQYPVFRGPAILYSGASVIGSSRIGRSVIFGAGSSSINLEVADGKLVVGRFPDQRCLEANANAFSCFFNSTEKNS